MASEVEDTATGDPGAAPPRPSPEPPARTGGGRHRAGAGPARVPARLRPGATGPRLPALDAVRGLAVVAMLLGPVGGGSGDGLAGYLAAPLFVLALGTAMGLALDRPRVGPRRVLLDNALRGLLLVLVGLLLQASTDEVDVVLPALGLLVVVLAPLALVLRPLPVLAVGLVVAGAVLGPLVTERARDSAPPAGVAGDLLTWTATGESHRLVSFLPVALAGVVLARLLPRLTTPALAAAVGAVLLGAGTVVHLVGAASEDGAAAASGTTAQVLAGTLLAAGAVAGATAVVLLRDMTTPRALLGPALAPLLALGRLALTAYTLRVLASALVAAVAGDVSDGGLPVLLGTAVLVVAACWVLDRRLGTGPLEALVRAARVPGRGRHGGTVSGPRPPRGPAPPG